MSFRILPDNLQAPGWVAPDGFLAEPAAASLLRRIGADDKTTPHMDLAPRNDRVEPVIVVSGLPRCGTSMMMRMLEAGGIGVVVDNTRPPDEDNPRGYYEFERVKKLPHDTDWLGESAGKAVKMVSMLLCHLPQTYRYKIIFMRRNVTEMIASQKRMRERQGQGLAADPAELERIYTKHLQGIDAWLAAQSNMEVLHMSYNQILDAPGENAGKVRQFLRPDLSVAKMLGVLDRSLYRNIAAGDRPPLES